MNMYMYMYMYIHVLYVTHVLVELTLADVSLAVVSSVVGGTQAVNL